MILIYTHKITNRNKYAFNLLLKDLLEIDFQLTEDIEAFKASEMPKFSYTYNQISDELFVKSSDILFETGMKDQPISVFNYRDTSVFFATKKTSEFPFDLFAASFYLVTRYEEYLPHIRDEHDRFDAKTSMAYKHGFLQKPLVNIYAKWLKKALLDYYPNLFISSQKFKFISSIDIDNAYAYREKGVVRNLGGYARAAFELNFSELADRTLALLGFRKDPFDSYAYQLEIMKEHKFKSIYFFLLGDYGVNDKNISVEKPLFQTLIKHIGDYADVGIHPSYGSNKDPEQVKREIERLSNVLHKEVTCSRQHFLKLRMPETYRNLIESDITADYTMGYATDIGFRASICTPFYFYDLDMEMETKLVIHPFSMMEGALKYGMGIAPDQAMNHIRPLIDEVKSVDGVFMSLWHNESLGERKLWKGWKPVYLDMVKYAMA